MIVTIIWATAMDSWFKSVHKYNTDVYFKIVHASFNTQTAYAAILPILYTMLPQLFNLASIYATDDSIIFCAFPQQMEIHNMLFVL